MQARDHENERPPRNLGEKPGFARWVEEVMQLLEARSKNAGAGDAARTSPDGDPTPRQGKLPSRPDGDGTGAERP